MKTYLIYRKGGSEPVGMIDSFTAEGACVLAAVDLRRAGWLLLASDLRAEVLDYAEAA